MTRARTLTGLLALLAASLGTNAVLALALRGPALPPAPAARHAGSSAPDPAATAGKGGRGVGLPAAAAACGPEVAGLEQKLATRSAELRQLAPARQLFEQGAPQPEAEARLAPLVAQALAPVEAKRGGHRLSCRDVACQVVFEARPGLGEEAADQALSTHKELASWIGQLEPAGPGTVYFKLNAEREKPAPGSERPATKQAAPARRRG